MRELDLPQVVTVIVWGDQQRLKDAVGLDRRDELREALRVPRVTRVEGLAVRDAAEGDDTDSPIVV